MKITKDTRVSEILKEYGDLIPHEKISIITEGITVQQNINVYEKIMDRILELGLATHPRFQNICFDGSKRGV